PPIATERLSLAEDGRVIYALRRHWKDGTRAFAFDPLDFIAKLAALVPRPRTHLLTYHGVLAPAAEWRDWIVAAAGAPRATAPRPSSSSPGRRRSQPLPRTDHDGPGRDFVALGQESGLPCPTGDQKHHLEDPSEAQAPYPPSPRGRRSASMTGDRPLRIMRLD